MYILLWMTWSILLMRILLRWTVDLLLWLSSLIECFIIYRICFYYLFFDYSLQWWLRVWWFENFSIYCVRLLMLVVSLMFLIVSPNVIISWAQPGVKPTLFICEDLNIGRWAYSADKKCVTNSSWAKDGGLSVL